MDREGEMREEKEKRTEEISREKDRKKKKAHMNLISQKAVKYNDGEKINNNLKKHLETLKDVQVGNSGKEQR